MDEPAEQTVARVLEPGEKILWSGRPNLEVIMEQYSRHRRRGGILGLVVMVIAVVWIIQESDLSNILPILAFDPRFLWGLAVMFLLVALLHTFKFDAKSRLQRHFRVLTYAMTDRRLLILEGRKLQMVGPKAASYTPEQIHEPHIRERASGYADVIFAEHSRGSGVRAGSDPIQRERRFVGFKAQPNAQEIKQRIEERNCGRLSMND